MNSSEPLYSMSSPVETRPGRGTRRRNLLGRLGDTLLDALDEVPSGSLGEDRDGRMRRASVAMILRPASASGAVNLGGLEIALIERARRPRDPWSGQVAMPGGGVDAVDRDLVETAIRETQEEVGLSLDRSACLGALGTHRAQTKVPALEISGFVFGVAAETRIGAHEPLEVASATWVPLGHLLDPAAAVRYRFMASMDPFPGVLLPDGRNVLWGLTYRFIDTMLGHLDAALPHPDAHSPVLEHDPLGRPSG